MADFLVKRSGPASVAVVSTPAKGGRASVHFKVAGVGAQRRVSIPDRHVDAIDPKHAAHLVRTGSRAAPADGLTIAAGPQGKRKRALKITG